MSEIRKLDITSTALEKGIDIAKEFIDKLIGPPIEEAGLLLKDHVTMWRFNNQVRMINKAKTYCEKLGINPKTISLKLLCPLLEYSSLEENDELQNKWAVLLTNLVDSTQNIENHVFPYILSQISLTEYNLLENVYDDKISRQEKLLLELEDFKKSKPLLIENLNSKISDVVHQIEHIRKSESNGYNRDLWKLERQKSEFEQEIKNVERNEFLITFKINEPQIVPEEVLQEFEIANLMRLGVIKHIQKFFANSQTLEIPYEFNEEYSGRTTYSNVDLEVDIESDEKYILTELGELFIKACKLKAPITTI